MSFSVSSHKFRFRRFGRFPHLVIENAESLRRAPDLDPAHWVALSAPVDGVNGDPRFLGFVDSGTLGRITHEDLASAVHWFFAVFTSFEGLEARSSALDPVCLDGSHPDGARIRTALGKLRQREGLGEDDRVPLELIQAARKESEADPASSAGIVLPQASEDPAVRELIVQAVSLTGGAGHPSGKQGLTSATLTAFVDGVREYLSWRDGGSDRAQPFGPDTPAVYERHRRLIEKLEQFFSLCNAAVMDDRVRANRYFDDATLDRLKDDTAGDLKALLMKAPLAVPNPEGVFRFDRCTNRYYLRELADFQASVVDPLLGEVNGQISFEQWLDVRDRLSDYEHRLESRPTAAEALSAAEPVERFIDPALLRTVEELIDNRRASELIPDNIVLAERAALYQANLLDLANNFVSFPYLYDRTARAMFEMGAVIMDGRYFNLAVRVENRQRHVAVAANSSMFVMYLAVNDGPGRKKYEIAVPVTAGGKGNLSLGKRGVFVDLCGREYDTEILEIIENPISLPEAILSPFRRLGRLITGKIESITSQASANLDTVATSDLAGIAARGEQAAVSGVATAVPQTAPGRSGLLSGGGLLLGGGVAIAAIASALAYITNTLAALRWYQVLIGVGSAVAAVILPMAVLAMVKLRRRDLSSIIEASGWAVNGRMRLSWGLSRFFTSRPPYPKGSKGVRSALGVFLITLGVALLLVIATVALLALVQ